MNKAKWFKAKLDDAGGIVGLDEDIETISNPWVGSVHSRNGTPYACAKDELGAFMLLQKWIEAGKPDCTGITSWFPDAGILNSDEARERAG